MARARFGPRTGLQPQVMYCPTCKGDIRPVPTNQNDAKDAHNYQCRVCDRIFEINVLDRLRDECVHDGP